MYTYKFWGRFIIYMLAVCVISYAVQLPMNEFLAYLINLGIFMAIGKALMSYSKPSEKIYGARFVIYNVFQIALMYQFVDIALFGGALGFWIMLAIYVGYMLVKSLLDYKSYQKGLQYCREYYDTPSKIYEACHCKDCEGKRFEGQLFLTPNHLVLFDPGKDKPFTEIELTAVEPRLIRHRRFCYPRGLYFPHHQIEVHINFPKFWLHRINQRILESSIA